MKFTNAPKLKHSCIIHLEMPLLYTKQHGQCANKDKAVTICLKNYAEIRKVVPLWQQNYPINYMIMFELIALLFSSHFLRHQTRGKPLSTWLTGQRCQTADNGGKIPQTPTGSLSELYLISQALPGIFFFLFLQLPGSNWKQEKHC